MTTYFEDIDVGQTYEHGERTVTRTEIIEFAERYDPQPFHVDETAARESMFGGLIASGWHTAAVCMRLLVDGVLSDWASMGARGVDEIRWLNPVRPGDTLSVHVAVVEKRPSESHPERGYVTSELTGINHDDEDVLSLIGHIMVERRESEARP